MFSFPSPTPARRLTFPAVGGLDVLRVLAAPLDDGLREPVGAALQRHVVLLPHHDVALAAVRVVDVWRHWRGEREG